MCLSFDIFLFFYCVFFGNFHIGPTVDVGQVRNTVCKIGLYSTGIGTRYVLVDVEPVVECEQLEEREEGEHEVAEVIRVDGRVHASPDHGEHVWRRGVKDRCSAHARARSHMHAHIYI